MRRLLLVIALAGVSWPGLPSQAQPRPQPAVDQHVEIGPPIAPRPAGFADWSHPRRAEWLLAALDYHSYFEEVGAWIASGDISGFQQWGSTTMRSAAADPAVALTIAKLFEALAVKAPDATLRHEAMRRSAIYYFGSMALTFVDDRICADDGARQETLALSAASAANARAWLNTVTAEERAQVLTLAVAMGGASWGKRQASLLLCWDSREALQHLDAAHQQQLGATTGVGGRTLANVYQPTMPGWRPPLRADAQQRREAAHDALPTTFVKAFEPSR